MKFSWNNNPGNSTTRQIQKYDKDRSEKLSSAQTQGDPGIANSLEDYFQISYRKIQISCLKSCNEK